MQNSGETKNEWILRELKAVKEKHKNRVYHTFEINVGAMASDCIDVIDDMEKENQILRNELFAAQQELLHASISTRPYFQKQDGMIPKKPTQIVVDDPMVALDNIRATLPPGTLQRFVGRGSTKSTQEVEAILGVGPIFEPQRVVDVFSNSTVEEHNALLEKMRAELRGDICE